MSDLFDIAVTRLRWNYGHCRNNHPVSKENAAGWALQRGLYRCARCFEEYAKHRKPTAKPIFVETDAGRGKAEPFELNDCTVRALATAADLTYAEAHAMLKAAGRRDRQGTSLSLFLGRHKRIGRWEAKQVLDICRKPDQPRTLGQFVAAYPVGRFIVTRRCHAFAVIDGSLHDYGYSESQHTRVQNAWHFTLTRKENK